jgi:hypothetical protein
MLSRLQRISRHYHELYDRTKDEISLDEVERIKFYSSALRWPAVYLRLKRVTPLRTGNPTTQHYRLR